MAEERCPSTTRRMTHSGEAIGIQCKFTKGHYGDHAGYAGPGAGDVFWPAVPVETAVADEDIIREAMAEAQERPGRIVTR